MVACASVKGSRGVQWSTVVEYDNGDFQNSMQHYDRDGEDVRRENVPPSVRAKLDAKVQMRLLQKHGAV